MTLKIVLLLMTLLVGVSAVFAQGDLASLATVIERGTTEAKRDALFAIRNMRSEEASRIAVPALKDRNILVRSTAASAVVFLPQPEAASLLIPMLGDRNEFIRREVAFALGKVGDVSAVEPLQQMIKHEKAVEVRSAVIIALGEIGDPSAVGPLIALLTQKPRENDEFPRRSAARSIGQIVQFIRTGRREVVTPENFLPQRFKSVPGTVSAKDIAEFGAATTRLLTVLADRRESDDTRREAAFALGTIGDLTALPALQQGISSGDYYLAEICREAVAKILASNSKDKSTPT